LLILVILVSVRTVRLGEKMPINRWPTLIEVIEALQAVISAAAEGKGKPICVAFADTDGFVRDMLCMDDVPVAIVDEARARAHTAAKYGLDTVCSEAKDQNAIDRRVFRDPDYTTAGGGVVVKVAESLAGAIGVSGSGSNKVDDKLAEVGRDHLLSILNR
jgi:uncharacterized protein GlcG (DUF336 family)